MSEIDDLANRQISLKWVGGIFAWLLSGSGGALMMMFYLGGYQRDTRANFERLDARMVIVEKAAADSRSDHDIIIEMRADVKYLAERARERDGASK